MRHEPTLSEKEQEYLKSRVNSEDIIHEASEIWMNAKIKVKNYSAERKLKPASFEKLAEWLKEKNEEDLS